MMGCAPKVFFAGFLPFFSGTKGLEAGMIYEGVDSKPLQYHSFTASQSSSVRAADLFLGVKHQGGEREFLDAMVDYMPQKHREFLNYIREQPSLRKYIAEGGDKELIKQFNAAVEALTEFRSYHVIMVTKYIINLMSSDPPTTEASEAPVMRKLKTMRDNTKALKIVML